MCICGDAIRHAIEEVPHLLIRGTQGDRLTELKSARLVGLGCGVQCRQRNLVLRAYFQDTDSGSVIAPYSPDLNTIEQWWFVLKNWVRQRWEEFSCFRDWVDAAFKDCP